MLIPVYLHTVICEIYYVKCLYFWSVKEAFLYFKRSRALTAAVEVGDALALGAVQEALMSRGPRFFAVRTWAKPSSANNTNGDKLRSLPQPDAQERKTTIKVAQFFVLVALLFVLADYLGRVRDRTGANVGPDSVLLVNLSLYPPERSENGSGFTVRFRLSNKGNRSIFYPTGTTTSGPMGQLVARASSTSDWMSLSDSSKQRVSGSEGFGESNLNWIEMPPGGWVDGEFQDVGKSTEEHAYEIYVKVARDGKGIRIVSQPYFSPANQ
jgi:hypothetical protein